MYQQTAGSTELVYSVYNDDSDFGELIEFFTSSLDSKIADFQNAFSSGNIDQLQVLAHQLKGSGAGYGYPELSAISEVLEANCKEGELQIISESLADLLNYLNRIARI